jgi:hypothetical protein
MKTARIKKGLIGPAVWLASAIAVIAACSNSDAGQPKAAQMKATTIPQEKPIKLRYYGGPKYPMYPQ